MASHYRILIAEMHANIRISYIPETEAPDETTITDQEAVQPIEEASTQEVLVPAGTSDILIKL